MATFICRQCSAVENTGCCNYWVNNGDPLCSVCDPKIGKWHNRFPRRTEDGRCPETGELLPTPPNQPLF